MTPPDNPSRVASDHSERPSAGPGAPGHALVSSVSSSLRWASGLDFHLLSVVPARRTGSLGKLRFPADGHPFASLGSSLREVARLCVQPRQLSALSLALESSA